MSTNVLIVESTPTIADSIREHSNRAGLFALIAPDTAKAWELLSTVLPDVVLVNWILTDQSGASFANQLHLNPVTKGIPFIMLGSRRDRRRDAQASHHELVTNADGYVTQPQRHEKVIAQVFAVLRRRQAPRLTDKAICLGGLSLDPSTREVSVKRGDVHILLTVGPTELRLLYFFMTHSNRVFTRTQLRDAVWSDRDLADERTVYSYVTRLRASLRPGRCDFMIEAVHGVGYRFVSQRTADSMLAMAV
jgi:two-component system phosphate regulon response regulator PhoB